MGFTNANSAELRAGYFVTVSTPVDNRMVVDKVEDLYGDNCVWDEVEEISKKKSPSYGNMLVSVAETNDLYMLKSHYNETTQTYESDNYKEKDSWKKIGSDVATTKDIAINGGPIADAFNNAYPDYNGTLPSGMTFDKFVELLLCIESFPPTYTQRGSISLSISNPTISNTNSISNGNYVEVGTVINFKNVTAPAVTVSSTTKPKVYGIKNGYATGTTIDTIVKDAQGNLVKEIVGTLNYGQTPGSVYKMTTTVSGFKGSYTTSASAETASNCIIGAASLTAGFGSNTYKINLSGCTYDYIYNEIPSYYNVSNLNKIDITGKEPNAMTKKLESGGDTTSIPTGSASFGVTGVYPVYHNISNGTLLDDATVKMTLQAGSLITINTIPSQSSLGKHFILDFPASKNIDEDDSWIYQTTSDRNNLSGYQISTVSKTINGTTYQYKRFKFNDTRNGEIFKLEVKLDSSLSSK